MDNIQLATVKTCCTNGDSKQFWKAVQIWVQKPHVVNRRLSAAVDIGTTHSTLNIVYSLFQELSKSPDIFLNSDRLQQLITSHLCVENENGAKVKEIDDLSLLKICIRKLIPKGRINANEVTEKNEGKDSSSSIFEVVLLDLNQHTATFVPLVTSDYTRCSYQFSLLKDKSSTRITLSLPSDYLEPTSNYAAVTRPTRAWLCDTLLPKLAKWASEVDPDTPVTSSHALLDVERYSVLYLELKQKYGPKFVKIWPENTDPQKFVYEDVAIATYILLLWEQEREEKTLDKKQSFVDLGCGNGFLVHILNSEGHPGKGIDLRSRKIWSLYGPGTNLEECSIIPSDKYLFPDTDWLIGNHSDELTPWIPVMATRSSVNTCYFVLPCCFHDFASKFVRNDSNKTQYRAYLDFIQEVGEICGFDVQEDTMRIPSTKRICQVGKRTTKPYAEENTTLDNTIQSYISKRCSGKQLNKPILNFSHNSLSSKTTSRTSPNLADSYNDNVQMGTNEKDSSNSVSSGSEGITKSNVPKAETDDPTSNSSQSQSCMSQNLWAEDFQPRSKVEAVRNCSRLSADFKEKIVNDIAFALLSKGGVPTNVASSENTVKGQKLWRRGDSMTMQEVVALFDSSTMKQLKNECGGLKTLLKNANQVFQVSANSVQLQDWSTLPGVMESATKKQKGRKGRTSDRKPIKTKQCWFYMHHPDGCPRLTSDCTFAHGEEDLQILSPVPHKST